MAKVLIVEDDDVIAQGMASHLTASGFEPVVVDNGETGLARLRFERPDVCIVDLMLPRLDGWRLIEQAREEGIGTPIVVVSARGTEHDRVHALEIGADDYLVKPFSMKELVARVRAASRRGTRAERSEDGEAIEIEELRIDPKQVQAYVDGESAGLTPTEFRVLYALALERGRVVEPRRAAAEAVGPPRGSPRPDRRRLRPQAAREDRSPGVRAYVSPDPVRRGVQAGGGAEMNLYFVCIGNAGRSQMAQALAEREGFDARSAGSRPESELHPEVIAAMDELGIDLRDRRPKGIEPADVEWADIVVTMGCGDACPVLPGKQYLDWELTDPIDLPLEAVREIRDDIERRIQSLKAELAA